MGNNQDPHSYHHRRRCHRRRHRHRRRHLYRSRHFHRRRHRYRHRRRHRHRHHHHVPSHHHLLLTCRRSNLRGPLVIHGHCLHLQVFQRRLLY